MPACLEENFSWTAELLVANRKLFWSSRRRQSSVAVAAARLGCSTPGSGSASGLARAASALAAMSLATDAAGRRRRGVGGDWPLAEGWLLLLALLVLPGTPGTRAFVCLPCDESRCEEPKNCPGGVVLDICGCCFICARQRNESCGGFFGLHGACDRGLRCVIRPPLNGDSLTEYEAGVCEGKTRKIVVSLRSAEQIAAPPPRGPRSPKQRVAWYGCRALPRVGKGPVSPLALCLYYPPESSPPPPPQ